MKTEKLNKNKMMSIIVIFILSNLKVSANVLTIKQNNPISLEFVIPIVCVIVLAMFLLNSFMRQKSH
mgnify:CR=1 FL=1